MLTGRVSYGLLSKRLRVVEEKLGRLERSHIDGGALTAAQKYGVWRIFAVGVFGLVSVSGAILTFVNSQTGGLVPMLVERQVADTVEKHVAEYERNRLPADLQETLGHQLRGSMIAFEEGCPADWTDVPKAVDRIMVGTTDLSANSLPAADRPEVRKYGDNRLILVSDFPSFVTVENGMGREDTRASDMVVETRELELLFAKFCTPRQGV